MTTQVLQARPIAPPKSSQPAKSAITPNSYTLTAQTSANIQIATPISQPTPAASVTKNKQSSKNDIPPDVAPNSQTQSTQAVPHQEKRFFFNPQFGLLKPLIEATTPLVLTLQTQPDYNPIYINPEQNIFYCATPLELLTPYFTRDNGLLATAISTTELSKTIKKSSLSPYPVRHLVWYTAFKYSRGKLIQGLSIQDTILLTQLPYVGPDSRAYINLAASLKKKAATLVDAAKEAGVTLELAIDFYNACHLAGLIEKKTVIEQLQKTPNIEKQSLLSKIKNRLKN
jgi:hypothetical protein